MGEGRKEGGGERTACVYVGETFDGCGSVGAGYADANGIGACVSVKGLRERVKEEDGKVTHKPLRRKMPTSCIFRLRSICKLQINGSGSRTVTTSETALMEPGMDTAKMVFTQEPSTFASQVLCTGVHWKTERSISAILLARITKAKHQRKAVKRGMRPKMR